MTSLFFLLHTSDKKDNKVKKYNIEIPDVGLDCERVVV